MLDMFGHPQGIAVSGASRHPASVAEHDRQGAISPINPNAGQILGVACYLSILTVPGPADLARMLQARGPQTFVNGSARFAKRRR